jgi:AcrR family transcriptional regulator
MASASPLAPRSPLRRRGDALLAAIHAAVLDELATAGYGALSIERVAERAHTGKASIYRRWPSRLELVLDALDHTLPSMDELPDSGDVREDLLIVLRRIAAVMSSREGDAARACLGPGVDDELTDAIRERLLAPRKTAFQTLLQRAADRGQISVAAVTPRIAETGPMLLHGEVLQRGTITDAAVVEIVDEVLLPLLRARRKA